MRVQPGFVGEDRFRLVDGLNAEGVGTVRGREQETSGAIGGEVGHAFGQGRFGLRRQTPAGRVNAEALHLKRLDPQRGIQGFTVGAQRHGVDLVTGGHLVYQAQRAVALVQAVLGNQAIAGAGNVREGRGVGVCTETAGNSGGHDEGFIHE